MIYLDNNATTKIHDKVLDAMLPYLREDYGNASSIQHQMGRKANHAIEQARIQLAQGLKCNPKELIFTSGATESINTVIKGVYDRYKSLGKHIITCKTEHKAVLQSCEHIEKLGAEVTYLHVDQNGQINLDDLVDHIRKDTILITLMAANNETGTILPIQQIAEICQQHGILFFCDATQYIGKETLDLTQVPIDILCLSAHKFHGPKGIGALYIRRKSKPTQVSPLIIGGKQEYGIRAGTYPTAQIVGLGEAFRLSQENLTHADLRDYFEQAVLQNIEDTHIHAYRTPRLKNTSNILFKHVKGAELMTKLYNIALSSGSACVSGDRNPSHVLQAMLQSDDDALCSLRFSFSMYNSRAEIDEVITALRTNVDKIRTNSPIWQMYKAGLID